MTTTFARRLWLATSLQLGAAFATLVIVGAVFAFGAYLGIVRSEVVATLDRMVSALDTAPATHDARVAGRIIAGRFPRASVYVLLIDTERRVVVYQPLAARTAPIVDIRRRGDTGGDLRPRNVFDRLILGLGAVFGLAPERAHIGTIDLIVRSNERYLARVAENYVPGLFLALVAALALGVAFARVLTLQALRPLVEVERALERFASGDLSPQPVAADSRHQLGSLARAYNGAIAQMESAFGERDRANAAMRQFIADAGHQLRTPLTVIRGFIAILRKGELRTPADAERILETMNRQSLVMGSLIEKLMLLDRWDTDGAPATVEAIDVGQLTVDVVAPLAEAYAQRRVHVDARPGTLAAIDPSDFTHALGNIIDNALKYTDGSIDVTVDVRPHAVEVAVIDAGPGMSPDEAAHAFDRFYRGARREVDGSGLGLAIARRAVERAGGTLTVTSSRELGSRFHIVLPSVERNAHSVRPPRFEALSRRGLPSRPASP